MQRIFTYFSHPINYRINLLKCIYSLNQNGAILKDETMKNLNDENSAIIGGTFDAFHIGHQEYIRYTFQHANKVFIFLSTNQFAEKLKCYYVEPYQVRKAKITKFIKANSFANDFIIIPLQSSAQVVKFCLNHDITKTVVSEEYAYLFQKINQKREKSQKPTIQIDIKPRAKQFIPELCSTLYHTFELSDLRALGIPKLAF